MNDRQRDPYSNSDIIPTILYHGNISNGVIVHYIHANITKLLTESCPEHFTESDSETAVSEKLVCDQLYFI